MLTGTIPSGSSTEGARSRNRSIERGVRFTLVTLDPSPFVLVVVEDGTILRVVVGRCGQPRSGLLKAGVGERGLAGVREHERPERGSTGGVGGPCSSGSAHGRQAALKSHVARTALTLPSPTVGGPFAQPAARSDGRVDAVLSRAAAAAAVSVIESAAQRGLDEYRGRGQEAGSAVSCCGRWMR